MHARTQYVMDQARAAESPFASSLSLLREADVGLFPMCLLQMLLLFLFSCQVLSCFGLAIDLVIGCVLVHALSAATGSIDNNPTTASVLLRTHKSSHLLETSVSV